MLQVMLDAAPLNWMNYNCVKHLMSSTESETSTTKLWQGHRMTVIRMFYDIFHLHHYIINKLPVDQLSR